MGATGLTHASFHPYQKRGSETVCIHTEGSNHTFVVLALGYDNSLAPVLIESDETMIMWTSTLTQYINGIMLILLNEQEETSMLR